MDPALGVLLDYQRAMSARVGRLALVITRAAPRAQPAMLLSRHFCKERWYEAPRNLAPLNRPENFELHAHKTFNLGGLLNVNSWIRNKTAFLGSTGAPQPIVLVEQDINTLADLTETTTFSEEQIQSFFGLALPEMDHILALYYPAEEVR
jgi:hypothetical protein